MRTYTALDALLPGTRKAILTAMFAGPERWWYLSDLARHMGVSPSSLQRELASLVKAGILRLKREGNRVYYQPNPLCPFLSELTGLVVKTEGVTEVLQRALAPFAKAISWAFVYGSTARGEQRSDSDVDLMVIGSAGLAELAPALRKAERQIGRAVNANVYSPREFANKLQRKDHFLRSVLSQKRIMVSGDSDELAAAFGPKVGADTQNKSARG